MKLRIIETSAASRYFLPLNNILFHDFNQIMLPVVFNTL
jgi:hypothetical protein